MDTISYEHADTAHTRLDELEQTVTKAGDQITLSGDVNAYAIVGVDGSVTLQTNLDPAVLDGISGDFKYTNTNGTPEEIGGIEAGQIFNNTSLQDILTNLLYPYQYPKVNEFGIETQITPLEVGDTLQNSNRIFTWIIVNGYNIKENSIIIKDKSSNTILASDLANDGNEIIYLPTPIRKILPESYTWEISGLNTKDEIFSKEYTVQWKWKSYFGNSTVETLTETDIKALDSEFDFTETKEITGSGYKYIVYPAEYGLKTKFTDVNTGISIAMLDPYQVQVTNNFMCNTSYYVHRTMYPIHGTLKINIGQGGTNV